MGNTEGGLLLTGSGSRDDAVLRHPQVASEEKAEFVNLVPFTPPDREKRLKAWLVARCDEPHYGERILYTLEADVPGPTQVEEDINKATGEKQVGWDKTSDVIRGNLLIIPVEDALFYVEPIYLQAKKPTTKKGEKASITDGTARRPKLELVVVKAGSKDVGTAKTLDEALDVIFPRRACEYKRRNDRRRETEDDRRTLRAV